MPDDPGAMIDGKGVMIYGQKRAGKTSIKDHLREGIIAREEIDAALGYRTPLV